MTARHGPFVPPAPVGSMIPPMSTNAATRTPSFHEQIARRVVGAGAVLLWAYAGTLMVLIGAGPGGRSWVAALSDWVAIPGDVVVVALVPVLVCYGRTGALRRAAWILIAIAAAHSAFMTVGWTSIDAHTSPALEALADVLYQAYYPLTSAACCLFFLSIGGSFRRPATWLDLATLLFGVMATLWTILYEPPTAFEPGRMLGWSLKLSYTICIGVTMAFAGLLCTRARDWRSDRTIILVATAALIALATDGAWLAHTVVGHGILGPFSDFGGALFATGDVVNNAFLATAIAFEFARPAPAPARGERALGTHSLVPALALLIAITLLVTAEAHRRGIVLPTLVSLLVIGSLLLLARQQTVRADVRRLSRELAAREAEARLTELVRSSTDVIAVVDASRALSFISPAASKVLSQAPESLLHVRAELLLGAAHAATLTAMLDRLMDTPAVPDQIEVCHGRGGGEFHWLRIVGHNRLLNPLIEGIVLTITDVTEQRTLEREVLDVASRERQRLSSDIHEGLGQELTGVALLLKGAVSRARDEPQSLEAFLEQIGSHVSKAIGTARKLARGLSPLAVERGSLGASIHRLAMEVSDRLPVRITVDVDFDEGRIDDAMADHLYRIAYEALNNALRHSGSRLITIRVVSNEDNLVLSVTDDGRGPTVSAGEGLGRRMMEYRCRLMGGTLHFGPSATGGSQLIVDVPLAEA